MEIEEPQSHGKESFLYLSSRALERAAYYGIRVLIVVYMIGETISMDRYEALGIYAWFTTLMIFSQIIGGVLGDLVVGNRKAIIFGAVLQAAGAFALCIPGTEGLYTGLALVILGGGLYSPNVMANFGKLYLNKVKLLDSAFGLDYLAINLGAFFGIMLISYYGEEHGFGTGFAMAGMLMLASILPIVSASKEVSDESSVSSSPTGRGVGNIFFAVFLVATFWLVYEMAGSRFYEMQQGLSDALVSNLPEMLAVSIQSVMIFPILIILTLLWTYFYSNYVFKLMLGFLFGALSFGVLFYIPEVPGEQHLYQYLLVLFFLGLSEAHIAPVVGSVVTQYSNPKYLATMFGLVLIPTRMLSVAFGYFSEAFSNDPLLGVMTGMAVMIALAVGLFVFHLVNRNGFAVTPKP